MLHGAEILGPGRYAQFYSQKQRLAVAPSEVVDIDIAWPSKVEDYTALARLGRSVDLFQLPISKSTSRFLNAFARALQSIPAYLDEM